MSDSIDSDISPTGFGQFSDGTTNSESTPGDKYSRQVGDSVTVQDGNKSTLLNGWSNTVTGGFEFKTVGGAYYTTVGGNSFSTIVGAGLNVSAGLKVEMFGGVLMRQAYGVVVEYNNTDIYRITKGSLSEINDATKYELNEGRTDFIEKKKEVAKAINSVSESSEVVTGEQQVAAVSSDVAIAGDSTHTAATLNLNSTSSSIKSANCTLSATARLVLQSVLIYLG